MGEVFVYGISDKAPKNVINTTSRSNSWSKGLSPFFLRPIGINAYNVENVWQYSKVYPLYVDGNKEPTDKYFKWMNDGFQNKRAVRYPMGKGSIPLYSLWNGEKLGYIDARKKIYSPLYRDAVVVTEAYERLYDIYKTKGEVHLWDFDGYDYTHTNLKEVQNNPKRKMGHAFVLAAMLKNDIKPIFKKSKVAN
jgi:hypothetical protein